MYFSILRGPWHATSFVRDFVKAKRFYRPGTTVSSAHWLIFSLEPAAFRCRVTATGNVRTYVL